MVGFLSVLAGVLIAVMISVNGQLSERYGVYAAAVIIHAVGLLAVILWMLIKKESFRPKKLPLWFYLGGAIGVGTTLFNNFSYGKISMSAIMALGLLGETVMALAIDQWGLLKMPRRQFHSKKLIGIGFMAMGILCILFLR